MAYDPKDKKTHQYGVAVYQESNFRQVLQQFSKNKITEKMIRKGLTKEENKTWNEMSDSYTLAEKSVRLWTGGAYKHINKVILSDNKEKLKKKMPLIREINLYVSNHKMSQQTIVFRKSKLSGNQLIPYKNQDKINKIYRHPMLISTTLSIQLCLSWSGPTIIKYIIPKDCLNASDISSISFYPNEKEILLPPYTAVKLVGYKEKFEESDLKDSNEEWDDKLSEYPLIILDVLNNLFVSKEEQKGTITHTFVETNEFEEQQYKDPSLNPSDKPIKGAPSTMGR